jgi:hypothetical protein
MPRHHSAQPDPDQGWPSCDDEQPGVSIRPLSHADLAALLAHLDHHQHDTARARPRGRWWRCGYGPPSAAPAPRPRPPTGTGGPPNAPPGSTRCRGGPWPCWSPAWPRGWSPPESFHAWPAWPRWWPRLGSAGCCGSAPAPTPWPGGAARLGSAAPPGCLPRWSGTAGRAAAVPGSAANIDHLVIGPGGVVVIDSKQYRGRLQLDRDGLLWHGRHLLISRLRRVRWEADQADEVLGIAEIQVGAIVAVHGARVPWGHLEVDGVSVAAARRVPDLLQALPPILGPERVAWLADRARLRFRPAA